MEWIANINRDISHTKNLLILDFFILSYKVYIKIKIILDTIIIIYI